MFQGVECRVEGVNRGKEGDICNIFNNADEFKKKNNVKERKKDVPGMYIINPITFFLKANLFLTEIKSNLADWDDSEA